MYSMGMTIYEVSFFQCRSGRRVEVVSGSDGQNTILRV